jgi:hypothetical protein
MDAEGFTRPEGGPADPGPDWVADHAEGRPPNLNHVTQGGAGPATLSLIALCERALSWISTAGEAADVIRAAELACVLARQTRLGAPAVHTAYVTGLRAEIRLAEIVGEHDPDGRAPR